MAFTKQAPEWNATGVEAPQSLKDGGWKAGVKPAADYFNNLHYKTHEAIKELQEKAGEVKTVNGQLPDTNGNVNVSMDTSGFVTTQTFDEHKTEFTTFKTSTEKTLSDLVSAEGLSKTRSNKDSFGTFTKMTFRRKSDNTLYGTSVLSGGTAPYYTTRTETFYDVDGITVLKTVPYSVTYDADGEWAGDV